MVGLRRSLAHLAGRLASRPVARYISRQRDRLVDQSALMPAEIKQAFEPYFDQVLLNETRVVVSEELGLPAVPCERLLRTFGMHMPSMELISAITLNDVVAVRDRPSLRLLFHELVHVAQFRLLGVATFAQLYVRGFLAEGSYEAIPLERCASNLEERFLSGETFSVEADVKSWNARGLF